MYIYVYLYIRGAHMCACILSYIYSYTYFAYFYVYVLMYIHFRVEVLESRNRKKHHLNTTTHLVFNVVWLTGCIAWSHTSYTKTHTQSQTCIETDKPTFACTTTLSVNGDFPQPVTHSNNSIRIRGQEIWIIMHRQFS